MTNHEGITRFKYTDRDYLSLRDQMVEFLKQRIPGWIPGDEADPSDFATAFIENSAYMGDLLSYYVDRAAQEASPLTANSPSNVLAWANLFGATPGMAQSAIVELSLTTESSAPITVPHRTVVRSSTGYQFEIMLDPDSTGVVPDSILVTSAAPVTVRAWEGVSITENGLRGRDVGASNGLAGQQFALPETFVDRRGLWADVYQETAGDPLYTGPWEFTYRLLDHAPDDRVFSIRTAPDGKVSVVFGDGVSGAIPPSGYRIRVYYRVTSGAVANSSSAVPSGSVTMIDTAWDQQSNPELVNLLLTNPLPPAGGLDPDSLATVRERTIQVARSQRRAVTAEDYESAARIHGEVLTASCSAKVWSRPTIFVLPTSPLVLETPDLKTAFVASVQELMEAVCMTGVSPDVFTGLPTPLNLTVTAYLRKGVRQSIVQSVITKTVLAEYVYENLDFDKIVSSSDILVMLQNSIPAGLLNYLRCELSPVYADQPVVEEDGDAAPVEYEDLRYSPRPGECLYVDEANLTVVLRGGIKDI